jgi:hypothetical protein
MCEGVKERIFHFFPIEVFLGSPIYAFYYLQLADACVQIKYNRPCLICVILYQGQKVRKISSANSVTGGDMQT